MKTDDAHLIRRSAAFAIGCAAVLLAGCENGGPCVGYIDCFPALRDAGTKAGDLAEFLTIQRADETSSGNVVLGQASPFDGKHRVSFAVRANRLARALPRVEGTTVRTDGATAASDFRVTNGSNTALTADVAVALWRGVSSGPGGLELTGSITSLQDFQDNSLHLASNGHIALGAGVRIGLLEETRTLPGISYSRSLRFLPWFDFRSDTMSVIGGGTMTVGGDTIDLRVASWRLAASKRFGHYGLTVGVGGDSYRMSGSVSAALLSPNILGNNGSKYVEFSTHRRNAFLGGSYTVRGLTFVGEYGHLSLSSSPISASNTFGGRSADMSRDYLSLGVRLGIGQ